MRLQQRGQHEERPFAPQQELERDIPELFEARKDHQARAEGDQGAGGGVFHVRDTVGAVFRAEPGANRVRGLREEHRQLGVSVRHVAGIRQFDG